MINKTQIELITIRKFLEMLERKELVRPPFQRSVIWTIDDDITFINGVLNHGCFNTIILFRENNSHLFIADGQQRLNALSRIFSGYDFINNNLPLSIFFNLLDGYFDVSSGSVFHVTTGDLFKENKIDHFYCHKALHKPGISDEQREQCLKNLSLLEDFFHIQVPCYIFHGDTADSGNIFTFINECGLPLNPYPKTICPFGNSRCNKEYNIIGDKPTLKLPTENPYVSRHSVMKTDFQVFLGFDDIDVAVMTVPQEIVNIMAIEREEILHARNEITALYYKNRDKCPERARKLIEDNSLPVLSNMEGIEEYDNETVSRITEAFNLMKYECLLPLLARDNENLEELFPQLNFNGVFISQNRTIKNTIFRPGCYIAEELSEDQRIETTRHELAHAYMFYHKKKHIRCKWIEEGLAEYLGKNLDKSGVHSGIEVSPHRYYNFLGSLLKKTPANVQEMAGQWLAASVPVGHWCELVNNHRKKEKPYG